MALECPICFELYNLKERKPKSLRCSHSICSECLVKLCQSDSIECPTCRRTTKSDEININYGLVDVVAEQCEECVKEKRARKCHHCNQELCMHCFSVHARAYNAEVNKELYNLRKELRRAIEKSMDRSLLDTEREKEAESMKAMKKDIQARRNELDELEKMLELELRRVNDANITKIKDWMSALDAEVDKCKDFVLNCEDKIKSQYTSGCTTEELVKLSAEAKKFSIKLQRMQSDMPSVSGYEVELNLHPQFPSDGVTAPNYRGIISSYKDVADKIIAAIQSDVEQLPMTSTKPEALLNSQLLVKDQKPMTSVMLTRLLNQKQVLGEQLFPLIHSKHPDLAGKITGMLLELDNSDLLNMLDSREILDAKVREAVMVLKAHQAKQATAHQGTSHQDERTAAQRPIQSAPMNKAKVSARLAMITNLNKPPGLHVTPYHD